MQFPPHEESFDTTWLPVGEIVQAEGMTYLVLQGADSVGAGIDGIDKGLATHTLALVTAMAISIVFFLKVCSQPEGQVIKKAVGIFSREYK